MKKQTIKINESQLAQIVKESVKKVLKENISEAENGGWVVDTAEAQEAYNLAAQELGEDVINSAIVRCLGDRQLAECLAYVFRMYDFREWKNRI